MNADQAIDKLKGVVDPEILGPLMLAVEQTKVFTFMGKPLSDCTDAELRAAENCIATSYTINPTAVELLGKEWKRRRKAQRELRALPQKWRVDSDAMRADGECRVADVMERYAKQLEEAL